MEVLCQCNEHKSKVSLLFLQALLEVVNDLFEEQTDLEKIVRKIMQRALTLLQCERCSVLLLEDIDSPVRNLFFFIIPLNICCATLKIYFFLSLYSFCVCNIVAKSRCVWLK